ncbi:MAG TPA: 2'-5' RNA ligase family protein [Gaiellaceae bacterium]
MPRTALVVPVAEASPYYDLGNGVPAHITVVFPFAEEPDEQAVRELVSRFRAFDFTLDRIEQFETGTRWLHPSPSAAFVDLTEAFVERWPEHPPYDGQFDEVIPHLTITVQDVPLPITARATEVALLVEDEATGRWSTRASFPLQGVA